MNQNSTSLSMITVMKDNLLEKISMVFSFIMFKVIVLGFALIGRDNMILGINGIFCVKKINSNRSLTFYRPNKC